MNAIVPKRMEFFTWNDIPIEFSVRLGKPCACGNGIDKVIYEQTKTEMHYYHALHKKSLKREALLKDELGQAKAEIRLLKQKLYGKSTESNSKSEKQNNPYKNSHLNRGQQPGSTGHGRRKQDLEVIDETIELPYEARCCTHCQTPYEAFSSTEDSEIIEVAVKGYIRKIKRQKYRSKCDCPIPKILTAPSVPRLIDKGKIGTSIWTSILLDKYEGHTPTYRFLEKLKNYGLELAQGTITEGLKTIAPLLTPVVCAMMKKSQREKHWHGDETRWEVFEEVEGKVGSRWYLWVFKSESVAYYKLSPSRGYRVPKDFFAGAPHGILNCDRYVVYKKLETNGIVILAICWAHVRRDFLELGKSYPKLSQWAESWVEQIGLIYKLNDTRLAAVEPEKFHIAHAELKNALKSMAINMKQELEEKKSHFAILKVLQSLSNHWKGLNIFVEHPEIPMDNNTAEQELRGPVTGRKGYYGSGSIWSAELASSMFTITRTLKIWKLNSVTWLHTYLEYCLHNNNLPPKDLRPFLPWLMSDERRKYMTKPLTIFPKLNTS